MTDLGFDVTLENVSDLRHHSGFLPAVCGGQQGGFEFDIFPAAAILSDYGEYPDLRSRAGDRDLSANFRFGGDLTECACAMAASAALAKVTDGVWFDPQDAESAFTADDAVEQARSVFREATSSEPLLNPTRPRSGIIDRIRNWLRPWR